MSATRRECRKIGDREACQRCGHEIEWTGREGGWRDRGNGRSCLPYESVIDREIISPTGQHTIRAIGRSAVHAGVRQ